MDEGEYLGLILSNKGFLGKKPNDVEKSCKLAVNLLTNEDWFTLYIDIKDIIHKFNSRVRSQLIYGAELLSYKSRKPFSDIGRRVVNQFITKLLNVGRDRPLAIKHQLRVQLALGLPTFEIVIEKLFEDRVATCLGRRAS